MLSRARFVMRSCTVSGNSASTGGGWYVSQGSQLNLTASSTLGNTASTNGGGGVRPATQAARMLHCLTRANGFAHVCAAQSGARQGP